MESAIPGRGPRPELLGRTDECALLDGLVRDIGRGESRSLILRGEAGIGKTALLEYLIAAASDLMVVRAAGVESEMELAHAGLHQLCGPLLPWLGSLPGPQRQALEVAFGLSARPAPDRFLVALAVLSLLSEASEERPVLCVVDDAQWLDQASALALAFVARRLLAEPVGLVFAARQPGDGLRELPCLDVSGLRGGDARALLASAVQFRLDKQVRDRIVAETRGNPLALLELPRGLSDTESAGFGPAATISGRPDGLEESFRSRIRALPPESRRLLLIAAADPLGEPVLLWRSAELQGISTEAAAPAVEAELCEFGVRVRFRHPLVRAAVYSAASLDERRRAHAALAEATDAEADPDRRAWHHALASAGPDEVVADELERSAVRARARGGEAAAAAFLERSVDLTADPGRRAERALAAAEAKYLAGSGKDALRLAALAEGGLLSEPQRVRADVLRGRVATMQRRPRDAPPLQLEAAQRLEDVDRRLARDTYRDAFIAAIYAGRFAGDTGLPQVAAAIRAAPPPPGPPSATDELLDAAALLVDAGYEAGAAAVRRALPAFRAMPVAGGTSAGDPVAPAVADVWELLECRSVDDDGAITGAPFWRASARSGDPHSRRLDEQAARGHQQAGDRIIHHVDSGLVPGWAGGEQLRYFSLSGEVLVLRTPPMQLTKQRMTRRSGITSTSPRSFQAKRPGASAHYRTAPSSRVPIQSQEGKSACSQEIPYPISAITTGTLALTAAAISVSSGTSRAATHAALAARTESFLSVNSAVTPPGQLDPGQLITSGTQIASPDDDFVLQMQSDGNLVIRAPGNVPLGDTHTAGHDGTIAVMQADGNFVLRAPGNIPIWAAGTDGHPGTVLQVQDDGGVVLYAPGHQIVRVLFPAVLDPQNNASSTVPSATVSAPATNGASTPGAANPSTSSPPDNSLASDGAGDPDAGGVGPAVGGGGAALGTIIGGPLGLAGGIICEILSNAEPAY